MPRFPTAGSRPGRRRAIRRRWFRDPGDATGAITYVVLLDWAEGKIAAIRDFRHARYVTECLAVSPL